MRRVASLLIIIAVSSAAVPVYAAKPSMPQPTFMPGDTWTYELHGDDRAEVVPLSITVLTTTPTTYTYRWRTAQETLVTTAHLTALSYGGIEVPWPLMVGKTWTASGAAAGVTTSINAAVDAFEPVTVPAGTFSTFRITIHACAADVSKSSCGEFWMWVNSAVKNAVKVAWSDDRGWDSTHLRGASAVLTSYRVTSR